MKAPFNMAGVLRLGLLVLLLAQLATTMAQQPLPPRGESAWPPRQHYQPEHPQHRLAWWYANESMRQVEQARDMVCGFTGQHWTLDWEVHYRWALRIAPRRAYQQVEARDRHLSTCRSRKLRDYQRSPYRRWPDRR